MTVGKVSVFADAISPAGSSTSITFSSTPPSSITGDYIYYMSGATKVYLKDASNGYIKVSSISGYTVVLDGVVATSIPAGATLTFTQSTSGSSNHGTATYSTSSDRVASDKLSTDRSPALCMQAWR